MNVIIGSVGQGGVNRPEDVGTIQTMLNSKSGTKLKVDKQCGPRTIQAIRDFQKTFLPAPDGRVDPSGLTWRRLTAPAAPNLIQLPQVSGFGYYSYSTGTRQYGTPKTIQALQEVAASFRSNAPQILVGIGDISFVSGGHMDPHVTHQHGTNADIRPLRKDNKQLPVLITDAAYSCDNTNVLIQILLAH